MMKKFTLLTLALCMLSFEAMAKKNAFETQVADAGKSLPARYLEGTMNNLSGPRGIKSWTLESWIYIPDTTTNAVHHLFGTSTASSNKGFSFELNNNKLFIRLFANGNTFDAFGSTTVKPGKWNHVAATFDNVTNVIKLYLNGGNDGTATKSWNYGDLNAKFYVGVQPRFITITRQNAIDEIKIWNYVKTEAEIKAGMTGCQGTDSKLILYYDFEGTDATTVYDKAGNVNCTIKGHSLASTGIITGQEYCAPGILYVNHAATGNNNGTSWADAYKDVRDAFLNANIGSQIWVAKGKYYRSGTNRIFVLGWTKDKIKLYGGFSGNGTETDVNQRDWMKNETIFSGDLGNDGDISNNAYTVFTGPIGTSTARITNAHIDGIIIQDGNSNTAGSTSASRGGAFFMKDYVKEINFKNCKFINNTALYGGGVYVNQTTVEATLNMDACIFTNNKSLYGAGATLMTNGANFTSNITNCLFNGNDIVDMGALGKGANSVIYVLGQNHLDLDINIYNTTIANNINKGTGTSYGGPVMFYKHNSAGGSKKMSLYNCIIWGNKGDVKTVVRNTAGTNLNSLNIHNTISEHSFPVTVGNITKSNIKYVDPLFTDTAKNDFTLKLTSPGVDAGTQTGLTFPSKDLAGNTRVLDSEIDMGCYENSVSVGTNKVTMESLSVYPNPTSGMLNIESKTKVANSIILFNLMGQKVMEVNENQNIIDVSNLPQGMYFIQVNYTNSTGTSRFIKE